MPNRAVHAVPKWQKGRTIRDGQIKWVWCVVSTSLGSGLIVAALLKASADSPQLARLGLERWVLVGIGLEALVGLVLISNWWPRIAALFGAGLFSVLALVSLLLWLRGESSCGCLGDIHSPPEIVAFLDIGFALVLLVFARVPQLDTDIGSYRATLRLTALCVLVGVGIVTFRVPRPPDSNVDFRKQKGERFALLDEIQIAENLGKGRWVLAFMRSDCAKCDYALEKFRVASVERELGFRVAVIQVLSKGNGTLDLADDWYLGRVGIGNAQIRTPQFVLLDDGILREATWKDPDRTIFRNLESGVRK